MDAELAQAVSRLRLKLKAAKGLIRDLTQSAAEVERLLDNLAHAEQPQEAAERHEHTRRAAVAA